jgi:type I restriction enzyme M protein
MNTPSFVAPVLNAINILKANKFYGDIQTAAFFVLYCFHKGYRVYFVYDKHMLVNEVKVISESGAHLNDIIVKEHQRDVDSAFHGVSQREIEAFLNELAKSSIDENYTEIINFLFKFCAISYGRSYGEPFQPKELTDLVGRIFTTFGSKSVYNPCAGSASYALIPNVDKYLGEELSPKTVLLARIRLDANGLNPQDVILGNVAEHDIPKGYDSLISTPPFAAPVSKMVVKETYNLDNNVGVEPKISKIRVNTLEDDLLWSFTDSECLNGIVIIPRGVCFTQRYRNIRQELVDRNMIDSIIELPQGIFYSTGISTSIIVLKKHKKSNVIKFVDGSNCFIKDGKETILNTETLFKKYISKDDKDVANVVSSEMDSEYDLSYRKYIKDNEVVPDGYQAFPFDDVFKICATSRVTSEERGVVITPQEFSNDILAIINRGLPSDSQPTAGYKKVEGNAFIALSYLSGEMKIAKLDYGNRTVFANSNQIVLSMKADSPIMPDYAIVSLLNSRKFHELASFSRSTVLRRTTDLAVYLHDIKLFAPAGKENQKNLYDECVLNRKKAELERLGIRDTISDLSHMLNIPLSNIEVLLESLADEEMSDNAKQWVKSLSDNFDYLNRLIQTVGADFTTGKCAIKKINVIPFLQRYINSWNNISHHFFEIELTYDSGTLYEVKCDEMLMSIALDCIFKNAQKHGFKNTYNAENRVNVSVQMVSYKNTPFVCISIANNGEPFPEHFGLIDYVQRGKFAGQTGHTGLGGEHVYSIVKKFSGYLGLSSNAGGEVIFDILLPADGANISNLNPYDNEENCL